MKLTSVVAAALGRAANEPYRAAFVANAAINVVASAYGDNRIRRWSKITLMPVLATSVLRRRKEIGPRRTALLAGGLGCGWIGDLVLLPPQASLVAGGIPFAVNHASYLALAASAGARPQRQAAALAAPLWLGAVALSRRFKPGYLPLIAGYGGLLVLLETIYLDIYARTGARATAAGGALFILSDALILVRALQDSPQLAAGSGQAKAAIDAAVMATYASAQLLLVDGLSELSAPGLRRENTSVTNAV